MARRATKEIELARARAVLAAGDVHPRVAGREGLGGLGQVPDRTVQALADSETREKITDFAAAAFHSRTIARAISGAARAAIARHVSEAARRFALSHQHLGETGQTEPDFAPAFAATKVRIAAEIRLILQNAEPEHGAEHKCLTAALNEVTA